MKRLFVLLMVLVAAIAANAQGVWSESVYEADELKGIDETYTAYKYSVEGIGCFIYWSNKEDQFRIYCDEGFFNYKDYGQYKGMDITVGLYSMDNKLVKKFDMWLDCESDKPQYLETRDAGWMVNPVGQSKKVKQIMQHLNKKLGFVRFLAGRYGITDFDFKVYPKE